MNVLSYPYFIPNAAWGRRYLLFYDKIRTIVPANFPIDADSASLKLLGKTGFVDPLYIEPEGFHLTDDELVRLDRLFTDIKDERDRELEEQELRIEDDGLNDEHYLDLHRVKLPSETENLFLKYNFERRIDAGTITKRTGEHRFHSMEKKAGMALMAILADKHSMPNNLRSVTHESFPYAANGLDRITLNTRSNAEANLASIIMEYEIPWSLRSWDVDEYNQLRDRYAKVRGSFTELIYFMADCHNLCEITNKSALESQLAEILIKIDEQIKTALKEYKDREKKTIFFLIGQLFQVAGNAFFVAKPKTDAVKITTDFIRELAFKDPQADPMKHAYKFLALLRSDILSKNLEIKKKKLKEETESKNA